MHMKNVNVVPNTYFNRKLICSFGDGTGGGIHEQTRIPSKLSLYVLCASNAHNTLLLLFTKRGS